MECADEYSSSSSAAEHSGDAGGTSATSPAALPAKRRAGRRKFRETRHPVYRGVRERGRNNSNGGGKWVCEVRKPRSSSRIWLGTYPTPEMAARAHDVAGIALRGAAAVLNFPDSAWTLPKAKSSSPEDIRTAAADAAERFRPPTVAAGVKPAAVDEEELYNMAGLIDSMAEGMMMTPPGMRKQAVDWDAVDFCHEDLCLWTHHCSPSAN